MRVEQVPGFQDSAARWLPHIPVLRRQALDLYGAEPQLCVVVLGVPLARYLADLNAIEDACRRVVEPPANDEAPAA